MFKVNDFVVHRATGVCQITDIRKEACFSGDKTEYYILHPVYCNNMTIKIPIDNPNILRAIITRNEVLSLIAKMPETEVILIDDERQRLHSFKNALKTGKSEEYIKIIKTLYLEKMEKNAANKKMAKSDEEIMNAAEKQLNEEFSIALNISPDEVLPYILDHISQFKTTT